MRAYCYTCRADTIVHSNGHCGFCDARITNQHKPTGYRLGTHSYIGTEAFYRRAYDRYLEVRSVRKVAAEVWQEAGYASPASCANTLHDVWLARGWPTYAKAYAMTRHGLSRRGAADYAHRRRQRVERGEIADRRCQGVKLQAPGKGRPCRMFAQRGSDYCRYHDPAQREAVVAETMRMRARLAGVR